MQTLFRIIVLSLSTALIANGCIIRSNEVQPAHGHFGLTWWVDDVRTGLSMTCEQAGANVVSIVSHNRTTGETFTDELTCNAYGGTTEALPPGRYYVDIQLESCDADCHALSVAPPLGPYPLGWGEVIDLGDVEFQVDR